MENGRASKLCGLRSGHGVNGNRSPDQLSDPLRCTREFAKLVHHPSSSLKQRQDAYVTELQRQPHPKTRGHRACGMALHQTMPLTCPQPFEMSFSSPSSHN